MKCKFIQINEENDNGAKIEMESGSDPSIDEIIEDFEHFLKGVGYVLPDNTRLGFEEIYDEKQVPSEADCDETEYIHAREIISKAVEGIDNRKILVFIDPLCRLMDKHQNDLSDDFIKALKNEIKHIVPSVVNYYKRCN